MEIGCIIGSLREKSFNRALFNTLVEVIPSSVKIKEIPIKSVPLYNADDEQSLPSSVAELKHAIESVDGVLLIAPEYNRSLSGVLKNVIDWASRPGKQSSWYQKPVAVMGATSGSLGTSAMQIHLKGILAHLGTYQMGSPEFFMSQSQEKLNEEGDLVVDEKTKEKITSFVEAFVQHIHKRSL